MIGAMKSATTTLHEQLARQPGVFMSRPKEPNFFSDDAIYARGWGWYCSLFRPAGVADLRGESSTHYTKLPTYPADGRADGAGPAAAQADLRDAASDRPAGLAVRPRGDGRPDRDRACARPSMQHPELIDYSRYSMQLQPFLDAYGFDNVLPVFFPRLVSHSQAELERIGRFLGHEGPLRWDDGARGRRTRGGSGCGPARFARSWCRRRS